MAPAAFSSLGTNAKDLLYGSKVGKFQYDKVLNLSSRTADGVEFTVNAVATDNRLDMVLKGAYATDKYSVLAALGQSGKLSVATSVKELAPGLTVGVSGTVPDTDSGKLSVEYAHAHATIKSIVSLTAAPKVDFAATTGVEGVTLGGEASYDTSKSAITKWSLGVGYTAIDYQVALLLSDKNAATALIAHKVTADTTLGAEVVRDLANGTTTFATGLSKQLDGGAMTKLKLNNSGIVSVLYEQELKARTRMTISGQFSALNLEQKPRFGFGYDIKY
ncbi:hypothetical protein D9Q98_002867 [Chlorella vulgaris]|uniref:Uncharacterized protein n=1 Tax=Chlorella vulgaris TaxID=3077 RepID=A0A9D4TUC4_CHLVU|nr:hypothetical protein D9Q98_002867 [Chlorella vulgaris]